MTMRVKISKRGASFEADPVELPGSPPIGKGGSIAEALGDFLIHYQEKLGIKIEVDATAEHAERERRKAAINQR